MIEYALQFGLAAASLALLLNLWRLLRGPALMDRVLAVDLHAAQIQGYFDIPVDHLFASPVLLDAIRDGVFSPQQPDRYRNIFDALVNHGDHYLLLADYASYVATQRQVDAVFRQPDEWSRRALLNVAGMGVFSSDRTILEYARTIWNTPPAPSA